MVASHFNGWGKVKSEKWVGNQRVVAAIFADERSVGDFCAILRRHSSQALVDKNATISPRPANLI